MRFGSYRIDIPFDQLKRYKRLLLQFPAGLKVYAREIADVIEERTNSEVFIGADPCFGACDLAIDLAKSIGADALIHFGHLPIPNLKIDFPVIFVNAVMDTDVQKVSETICRNVREKSINLVTTAQHIDFIHSIKRNLESQGFLVHIGEGDGRISKPGLVLGCNFSSALHGNANSIVFIGTGNFHPVGISLATSKPVYALDPVSMKIKMPEEIANEKDKLLKKRYSLIALSKDANKFGIIISSKIGQRRLELAMRLKEEIEKMGKDAHLLVLDNVNPSLLRDFGKFDCLISTACPRIAIDDYDNFDSPILTPIEFEILIGKRDINEYVFDAVSLVQNSR